MDKINGFENYSYSIGPQQLSKKHLSKQLYKVIMDVQWTQNPNLLP